MTTIDRRAFIRFFKYMLVGGCTFSLDLSLLFLFIDVLQIPLLVATAFSFTVAVFCNYLISRHVVFHGTERSFVSGGVYFFLIAFLALFVITSAMYVFVEVFQWHFLLARITIASMVGTSGYFINLFLNFQMAGRYLES